MDAPTTSQGHTWTPEESEALEEMYRRQDLFLTWQDIEDMERQYRQDDGFCRLVAERPNPHD